ncbi:MAG: hypothetical protein RBR65_02200 [Aliarcobacter sp.]|jgi:hypothetical protein|nr:hypothetical protein [Aliarcobacter sp.]
MKKIILLILTITLSLFAFNSKIEASYAIGIFDEYKNGENIQHKRISVNNYNGTCYSKIVIFGNISNAKIEVKIGNSLGFFENSTSIYNKYKIKIGEEMTFKHYNIDKGYFEVRINNKLYDTKVFIK